MADYSYANLAQIKSEIDDEREDSPDATAMLERGQSATDRIDEYLSIRFAPYVDTLYFEALELECDANGYPVARLPAPLLSVTTFTDNAGNTLVANTDYLLLPRNNTPKTKLQMSDYGVLVKGAAFDEVASITGVFGWRRNYSTAFTQLGTVGADSGATITVSNGALFSGGEFLRIGSEFIGVQSVSDNTLTVNRAVNGSTTATHANGTAIYRFNPEPGIVRACQIQTKFMFSRIGVIDTAKYDPSGAVITTPTDLSGEAQNTLMEGAWNDFEMWIPYR